MHDTNGDSVSNWGEDDRMFSMQNEWYLKENDVILNNFLSWNIQSSQFIIVLIPLFDEIYATYDYA